MASYIFENARILDGSVEDGVHDQFVRVSGNMVEEVSDKPLRDSTAQRIDLRGKTLMPGLIDCHVHINGAGHHEPDINASMPNETILYHSVRLMKEMLNRGFTTVRDLGGATFAQVQAVEQGLVQGPRLIICGKAMVQNGGHSDYRSRHELGDASRQLYQLGSVARVVDGVDDCRKAARDEVRKGAQFIKVMANGGAASNHFPRPYLGFSMEELRVFQDEADKAKMYVSVHTHSDEAVARALELGIHSIEHATLITPETAETAARQGAIVTPTISAYEAQIREGKRLDLDPAFVERLRWVRARGPESLEIMRAAGVKLAYGTDVLGSMFSYQSEEFMIRNEVLSPLEIIKSATLTAAELVRMEGKVGTIAPGAFADLLVVEKDPLKDISVLAEQGRHMSVIMKDGVFIKNHLTA